MRTQLCSLLLGAASFLCVSVRAQNWVNGGNNLSANGNFGINTNFSLIFKTNNAERGRITNGGNWGIGTTNPISKFQVNGFGSFGRSVTAANATRALNLADADAVMRVLRVHATNAPAVELISRTTADGANVAYWDFYVEPTDKSFRIRDRIGTTGLNRFIITSNGSVGIGTITPATQLHVVGRGRFTTGVTVDNGGIYVNQSAGNAVEAYGNASNGIGVYGRGYYGVYGSGATYGVYGSGNSYGVYATSSHTGMYASGPVYGVRGFSDGSWGVWGQSNSNLGVYGSSSSYYGVYGFSSTYPAIYGTSSNHYGLEAHSGTTWGATAYGVAGLYAEGTSSYGVYGTSTNGWGGYFFSANSYGIWVKTGRADKNYAAVFEGNLYAYGLYQTSDKNLKKNVEDFSDALDIINRLKPRSYEFRQDNKVSSMHLPAGKHYGFIAQDIEEILPQLVKEVDAMIEPDKSQIPKPTAGLAPDAKEPVANAGNQLTQALNVVNTAAEKMKIKSINYIEFIPLLVRGMQEQDKRIEEQKAENDNLRQEIAELRQLISDLKGGGPISSAVGALEQNSPNPVRGATLIRYRVPEGIYTARLTLINSMGQELRSVALTNRGTGQVNLDVAGLAAGIYHYSLWVDGRKLATKQLVIAQ